MRACRNVAALATLLLAAVCVSAVHASLRRPVHHSHPRATSSNWTRPTIEGLRHVEYDTRYDLYYKPAGGGAISNASEFSWLPAEGFERAVQVHRNNDVAVTGLDVIEVSYNETLFAGTGQNFTDAYYAAGYAEGYLTFDAIYSNYVNQIQQVVEQLATVPAAQQWLAEHFAFLRTHETVTPFGQQLARQVAQIDGMAAGWKAYYDLYHPANVSFVIDADKIFYVNFQNGMSNLQGKFSAGAPPPSLGLHCSALMKLTPHDLFFSHDTWSSFNGMLRQYKTYRFGNVTVAMSGYAGFISSTDDFYVTSANLAITETTNGFYNVSLYQYIVPNLVSEFHRAMIATFLATSPAEWFDYFKYQNGGTYNNQYMVADMTAVRKAIDAGQPLPPNSFWVGEQLPGMVVAQDQTAFLNENKHWPSYNIPYYPEIYNISGFAAMNVGTYGILDYHKYARARIFQRMQGLVTDETTMWYMMRYNDWETDPASAIPWCTQSGGPYTCNVSQGAALTISARYDLAIPADQLVGPVNVTAFTMRNMFGAIDTKMTSARMVLDGLRVIMQNGPTAVQQPVFNHSAFVEANPGLDQPWRGLANVFDFPPIALRGRMM